MDALISKATRVPIKGDVDKCTKGKIAEIDYQYFINLNATFLHNAGLFIVQNVWKACIAVRMHSIWVYLDSTTPYNKVKLSWTPYNLHLGQALQNSCHPLSNYGCPYISGSKECTSAAELAMTQLWDPNNAQWLHIDHISSSSARIAEQPSVSLGEQQEHEGHNHHQQVTWCVQGKKITLKPVPAKLSRGSELLQEMGLTIQQQCHTWDLLWERGKPKKVSQFLWRILTKNLPVGASSVGKVSKCARCLQNAQETIRHCLFDCPKAQNVWTRVCRFRRHLGIMEPVTWEQVLLGSSEVRSIQESLRHGSSSRCIPQDRQRIRKSLKNAASIYLWELVRAFTLWNIWTARCSFVCHHRDVPVDVIILRIWNELLLSARSLQEDIKEKLLMHQYERAHRLDEMFWVCYHYKDTLFKKGAQGSLSWYTNPPMWLLSE